MKLAVLLFIIFFFLMLPFGVYAQQKYRTNSNIVTTRVGNPSEQSTTDVLGWGGQINSSLTEGFDGGFNRLSTAITNANGYTTGVWNSTDSGNKYWCTYLVIDSYNLSGIEGLSRGSGHGGVVYMMGFWRNDPRYKFLDYYSGQKKEILEQVKSGYAMFFQDNPGATSIGTYDHAALVSKIEINPQGDGYINTIDSNLSGIRGVTYPVSGWDIKGTLKGTRFGGVEHPNYSVMGFGTIN